MILTQEESVERIRKIATDEFLSTLTDIAKIYGWTSDYIEVQEFVLWIYRQKRKAIPDMSPYELDDNDNIIIP